MNITTRDGQEITLRFVTPDNELFHDDGYTYQDFFAAPLREMDSVDELAGAYLGPDSDGVAVRWTVA